MPDTNLIQIIKRAALDAVKASKPCCIVKGIVVKVNPVEVKIKQDMILDEDFLWIPGRIYKNIKKGDKVVLLRQDGGQILYILDQI